MKLQSALMRVEDIDENQCLFLLIFNNLYLFSMNRYLMIYFYKTNQIFYSNFSSGFSLQTKNIRSELFIVNDYEVMILQVDINSPHFIL